MKRIASTVMLAFLTLTLGLLRISGAEAVNCGDTLGPGGSFTFTADLGPCATATALTVHGPTVVDLAGHTVSCETGAGGIAGIGIDIIGKGAVVRNGRVTNCEWGVVVQGGGGHQVRNVLAEGNAAGFYVGSAHNALDNNGAVSLPGLFADGFFINGDSNVFTGNTVVGYERGFFVAAGCTFICGTASHNALSRNTATGNGTGFFLFSASNNTLASNKAFANGTSCCPGGGIHLDGDSTRNSISANVALGNVPVGSVGAADLSDDNGGCDTNDWANNVFGTRSQVCIR